MFSSKQKEIPCVCGRTCSGVFMHARTLNSMYLYIEMYAYIESFYHFYHAYHHRHPQHAIASKTASRLVLFIFYIIQQGWHYVVICYWFWICTRVRFYCLNTICLDMFILTYMRLGIPRPDVGTKILLAFFVDSVRELLIEYDVNRIRCSVALTQ